MAFAAQQPQWSGKASELLKLLQPLAGEEACSQKEWPKRPNIPSSILRRLAPNLRAKGVVLEFPGRNRKGRSIIIRQGVQNSVTSVTDRHAPHFDAQNGDPCDAHVSKRDAGVTHNGDAKAATVTQRDGGDAQKQPLSGCAEAAQSIHEREVAEI